ncbi:LacI family DNA-binding transcriptional regulator [Bacillus sp. UMB0728]|uniref:LacI family DNA-binding transcriptional regulator n=1 Tax=Bacillus sp. UMB0728 TaxID=2066052 RepID=UPI000C789797|nr:LacI family DNA-binding transcriptional regulator [Bacillus sp. UMB0728]PLR73636.1 LacI family transcriptional regulator [Bacillus sp. UMB0728]
MKKNSTIRDVARKAGVSVATVSRYINSNGYISGRTGEKIQEVMLELDYRPNEIARGLARKKTDTIALIIPEITNPFFPELVVSIERKTKEKGYSLILIHADEESLQDSVFWRNLESRYIDGLILASFQFSQKILNELDALQVPFVRIDRAADHDSPNSIGMDNRKGARLAVSHLIESGCKKIAHISGPHTFPPSIERLRGYEEILAEQLPSESAIVMEGDFTLESGKSVTEALMKQHSDIDGLFLANDMMAIGALKTLKQLGKKVPEDIAVIGFDGIKLGEMVEPELSTIEQPIFSIGTVAAARLVGMIENNGEYESQTVLDVRLVIRESTKRNGQAE